MLHPNESPVPAYYLQAPENFLPDPSGAQFPPDDSDFFIVDLFDETLGALLSDESRYIVPREMWIESFGASFSAGSAANPPFAFEIMRTISDPQGGPDDVETMQEIAINGNNICGTAQKRTFLKKPMYLPAGSEIVCRVTNLQNGNNAIQVVLYTYLRDLPGEEQPA